MYLSYLFVVLLSISSYGHQACIGFDHSCRIREEGTATCVGENDYGQLGLATYQDNTKIPGSTTIDLITNAKYIICSVYFTCVLLNDGSVYCWGVNAYGQLGLGSEAFSVPFPFGKVNIPYTYSLCCGDAHCLAISQSYTNSEEFNIYGWGLNNLGQLCTGNSIIVGKSVSDFPLKPSILPTGIKIDNSTVLRCAANGGAVIIPIYNTSTGITTNKVYAWGDNRAGQLAYGTNLFPYDSICDGPGEEPVEMIINGSVIDIGFGYNHSSVLLEDGSIRSAGDNEFGQLGYPGVESIGTTLESLPAPPVETGFVVGDAGFYRYHTCFSEQCSDICYETKKVACYGLNIAYQLGLNNTDDNIGYNIGSMPPISFLLPSSFEFIYGPVPYLNSMGKIYTNEKETFYIGWGGDNYTLQVGQNYVIGPTILSTECGDGILDKEAGEECEIGINGISELDGIKCTAVCYNREECPLTNNGTIDHTPLTENTPTWKDILGCRKPNYKCKYDSPISGLYCIANNTWVLYSQQLEERLNKPYFNYLLLWYYYNSKTSDNILYVDGNFTMNNKTDINMFYTSDIKENVSVSIIVKGHVYLTGGINWYTVEDAILTIYSVHPIVIDNKISLYSSAYKTKINYKYLNTSTIVIKVEKDKETHVDIFLVLFVSLIILIFVIIIILGLYCFHKERSQKYNLNEETKAIIH